MPPLVSIIIPFRNAADTLADTLESVRMQTWNEWELILVDDGSTDESMAIAEASGCQRMRLIRTPEYGACSARNHGIRAAHGDYFQFLDADDLLRAEKIEFQVQALLDQKDQHAVAYGPWWGFGEDLTAIRSGHLNGRSFADAIDWLFASLADGFYAPPHCWLVPASVIRSIGGWHESLLQNQDGEYFSRVLMAATSAIWVPESDAFYRERNPQSISEQRGLAYTESLLLAANLIRDRMLCSVNRSTRRRFLISVLYLRILYRMDPKDTHMLGRIWREIEAHGLPPLSLPFGSRRFNRCKEFLGWRLAFKCKYLLQP